MTTPTQAKGRPANGDVPTLRGLRTRQNSRSAAGPNAAGLTYGLSVVELPLGAAHLGAEDGDGITFETCNATAWAAVRARIAAGEEAGAWPHSLGPQEGKSEEP